MKTMYRAERETYTDMEGRNTAYITVGEYKDTIDEAEALVKNTEEKFPYTGSYRVIAMTMDENTFTYTEKVVLDYNYEKEVGRWKRAERMIASHEATIAEIEASKKRVRTERGMAKKDADIARFKGYIAEWEQRKAKWAEE